MFCILSAVVGESRCVQVVMVVLPSMLMVEEDASIIRGLVWDNHFSLRHVYHRLSKGRLQILPPQSNSLVMMKMKNCELIGTPVELHDEIAQRLYRDHHITSKQILKT